MNNMEDPYKILGVSPSDSEEEITKAYRKLAKKHHPDLNPGDKIAEQKMSQINAAYERIKTAKTGGAQYERPDGSYGQQQQYQSDGRRGYDPYGGFDFGGFEHIFEEFFRQGQGQQDNRQYGSSAEQQAYMYIQARQYQTALRILSQIQEREANWYYISALANAGISNRITALNNAKEAVQRDPENEEYRNLLEQFQQGSFTYQQAGRRQGFEMQNVGSSLMRILLAQMFCFLCCRPC